MKAAEFQAKVIEELGALRTSVATVIANDAARSEEMKAHEAHDTERFTATKVELDKTNNAVGELKKAQDAQLQAQVVDLASKLNDQSKTAAALKHDWQKNVAMVLIGAFVAWLLRAVFHVP
jgi:hypothetical protein